MQTRHRGIIKVWRDDKGFGFIAPVTGDADLFFHITSVANSSRRDLEGQRVTYTIAPGRDGKPSATDVCLASPGDTPRISAHPRRRRSGPGVAFAFMVSFAYLAAAFTVAFQLKNPLIPLAYITLSILTYVTYEHDKACAQSHRWRVSEANLHFMELIGGWPGALIAQWTLSHKNRKGSYQFAFWVIVFFHIGLAWSCAKQLGWLPGDFLTSPAPSGSSGIIVDLL